MKKKPPIAKETLKEKRLVLTFPAKKNGQSKNHNKNSRSKT
jgi:hypothetical protein